MRLSAIEFVAPLDNGRSLGWSISKHLIAYGGKTLSQRCLKQKMICKWGQFWVTDRICCSNSNMIIQTKSETNRETIHHQRRFQQMKYSKIFNPKRYEEFSWIKMINPKSYKPYSMNFKQKVQVKHFDLRESLYPRIHIILYIRRIHI